MVSALVIARSLYFDMENVVCILIYILHRCHIKHNTEVAAGAACSSVSEPGPGQWPVVAGGRGSIVMQHRRGEMEMLPSLPSHLHLHRNHVTLQSLTRKPPSCPAYPACPACPACPSCPACPREQSDLSTYLAPALCPAPA